MRHDPRKETALTSRGPMHIVSGWGGRAVRHATGVAEGAATPALDEVALVLALSFDKLTAARARAKALVTRVLQQSDVLGLPQVSWQVLEGSAVQRLMPRHPTTNAERLVAVRALCAWPAIDLTLLGAFEDGGAFAAWAVDSLLDRDDRDGLRLAKLAERDAVNTEQLFTQSVCRAATAVRVDTLDKG